MKKQQETRLTVRFPDDIAAELRRIARANDRSFNSEIVHAAREYVKRHKEREQRKTQA